MINLITEEDVKKIQSELTEDQIRQLIYLLQKDKLVELKELARKKCKIKFPNHISSRKGFLWRQIA